MIADGLLKGLQAQAALEQRLEALGVRADAGLLHVALRAQRLRDLDGSGGGLLSRCSSHCAWGISSWGPTHHPVARLQCAHVVFVAVSESAGSTFFIYSEYKCFWLL